MTCFLVARYTIKDAVVTNEYAALAAPTMAAFEGQVLERGVLRQSLAGSELYEHIVIAGFPSKTVAENWYYSKEYQELIALRDKGVDIVIALYE